MIVPTSNNKVSCFLLNPGEKLNLEVMAGHQNIAKLNVLDSRK